MHISIFNTSQILRVLASTYIIVRVRLCQNDLISEKKVSFDFAIALRSIGAPDIPKNFAQRSEMENMVF